MSKYRKTITAVAAAVLTFVIAVLDSEQTGITSGEVKLGIVLVAGALGVYAIPNAGVGSSD